MELDINELLNFSPLMKTFTFNAWVVAGFTPITRGSTLDYYINRPQGMKGYIINLTLRGQAGVESALHLGADGRPARAIQQNAVDHGVIVACRLQAEVFTDLNLAGAGLGNGDLEVMRIRSRRHAKTQRVQHLRTRLGRWCVACGLGHHSS